MKKILGLSEWETRITDCFALSLSFKSTQTEHLAQINRRINEEVNRKHGSRAVYSTYIKGFVLGFTRAKSVAMMRENIEFCYIVDGVMYSVREGSKHLTTSYYRDVVNPESGGAILCNDSTERGLFWSGTDKRFY